jgi:hypothetical protein
MTTHVKPYCAIHGFDITDLVYASNGIEPSGGGVGVEEILVPGRNYADIRHKGREPKKYRLRVRSTDREEIEAFLNEVNTAPEDSEFYPFDAQRFGLIAAAKAMMTSPRLWGSGKLFYEAEAEILCRESWLYGPDKGIPYTTNVNLPAVSELISNNGHERAPMTYMQASGDISAGNYVENLSCRITPNTSTSEHDREIKLCEKMLRGDIFEVGWRKRDVIHSYHTTFDRLWSDIVLDFHSKYSGGAIYTSGLLTLWNNEYIMIPFYGPLPISGEPESAVIEFYVNSLTGDQPAVQVAREISLSDMQPVDHDDIVVGFNRIEVPGLEGEGHVALGLKAGNSCTVDISELTARVKRYLATKMLPWLDPGESGKIRVECTAGNKLKFLEVDFNDRYWY